VTNSTHSSGLNRLRKSPLATASPIAASANALEPLAGLRIVSHMGWKDFDGDRHFEPAGKQADRGLLRYFPVPLSCGTMQLAVPVTSLPARSRAVTVR
jgi:hypothetical protein